MDNGLRTVVDGEDDELLGSFFLLREEDNSRLDEDGGGVISGGGGYIDEDINVDVSGFKLLFGVKDLVGLVGELALTVDFPGLLSIVVDRGEEGFCTLSFDLGDKMGTCWV